MYSVKVVRITVTNGNIMNSSVINYEVTSEKKLINELLDEKIHISFTRLITTNWHNICRYHIEYKGLQLERSLKHPSHTYGFIISRAISEHLNIQKIYVGVNSKKICSQFVVATIEWVSSGSYHKLCESFSNVHIT